MAIRFQHLGSEWEATPSGMGHSVGFGSAPPPVNRWGFVFRRVGDPAREHRAHVSTLDPESPSQPALVEALEEALVRDAIEGSKYIYRPAEKISLMTGIPLERVRRIIETSDDFIEGPRPNAQGLTLYSTRDHYRRHTGFIRRYLDTLESS
jgi:hypothetical protein